MTSSKLPRLSHQRYPVKDDDIEKQKHNDNNDSIMNEQTISLLHNSDDNTNDQITNEKKTHDDSSEFIGSAIMARIRMLVFGIRKFSCVIVVWNIFFMILMVFVFGSWKRIFLMKDNLRDEQNLFADFTVCEIVTEIKIETEIKNKIRIEIEIWDENWYKKEQFSKFNFLNLQLNVILREFNK